MSAARMLRVHLRMQFKRVREGKREREREDSLVCLSQERFAIGE